MPCPRSQDAWRCWDGSTSNRKQYLRRTILWGKCEHGIHPVVSQEKWRAILDIQILLEWNHKTRHKDLHRIRYNDRHIEETRSLTHSYCSSRRVLRPQTRRLRAAFLIVRSMRDIRPLVVGQLMALMFWLPRDAELVWGFGQSWNASCIRKNRLKRRYIQLGFLSGEYPYHTQLTSLESLTSLWKNCLVVAGLRSLHVRDLAS